MDRLDIITNDQCKHVWVTDNIDGDTIKFVCAKCGSIVFRRLTETKSHGIYKDCTHDWRVTHYHEVPECLGLICTKCGKLSCACDLTESDYENWVNITNYEEGDEAYEKFYRPDNKTK